MRTRRDCGNGAKPRCAHWLEQQPDPDAKIGRPRQIYTGYAEREYLGIDKR
jgi:citrate synthase